MAKKYKIVAICLAGLFLAANVYVDFFAATEPKYWETIRFIGIMLLCSAAILNGLLYGRKAKTSPE